jgi:hypothetical protein
MISIVQQNQIGGQFQLCHQITDYFLRLDRCDAQEAEPSAAKAERLNV